MLVLALVLALALVLVQDLTVHMVTATAPSDSADSTHAGAMNILYFLQHSSFADCPANLSNRNPHINALPLLFSLAASLARGGFGALLAGTWSPAGARDGVREVRTAQGEKCIPQQQPQKKTQQQQRCVGAKVETVRHGEKPTPSEFQAPGTMHSYCGVYTPPAMARDG